MKKNSSAEENKNLQRMAKLDLDEKPEDIPPNLSLLKDWVKTVSYITFPLDDKCLLAFLRYCKHDQDKARMRLLTFCKLRASEKMGCPTWFKFFSLDDPVINKYLDAGILVELGKTKDNVTIFLSQLKKRQNCELGSDTLRQMIYMDIDRYLTSGAIQVSGYGFFIDMEGMNENNYVLKTTEKDLQYEHKIWHDGLPIHLKYMVYYKESPNANRVLNVVKEMTDPIILERIFRVKDDLQRAYDAVPGLKEIMPSEYGGDNESITDLIAHHSKKFKKAYGKKSPWVKVAVDDSKVPEQPIDRLRTFK